MSTRLLGGCLIVQSKGSDRVEPLRVMVFCGDEKTTVADGIVKDVQAL